MYDIDKRLSFLSHITVSAAAGLFAGMLVALWETSIVLSIVSGLREIWILPYSIIYYGLLIGVAGIFVGIGGAVISKIIRWSPSRWLGFLIYFAFLFMVVSVRVGIYRYYQLILRSQRGFKTTDWLMLFGAVAIVTVILVIIWKILSRIGLFKTMSGIVGALGWYVALGVVSIIIASLYGGKAILPDKSALASQIEGRNVILIIIDTLRADRVSVNGYDRINTPHFDQIASEGINYTYCYGQSSWTKPQIASILTSMYPSSHRAIEKIDALPDGVYCISELFADKGYYTVGIVDNVNITETFNFNQGYDEFYFLKPDYYFMATESAFKLSLYSMLRIFNEKFSSGKIWVQNYYQPAKVVTDEAVNWLDSNKDKRFFMLVHYMDPHDPFFKHPYNGVGYARAANPNPPASVAQEYSETYDEEIVYHDKMMGRLLDYLKENNLYDSSIVIVTADHGEEFHEHGGWWHGYTLYNEVIRVPLVIKPAAGTYEPHTDTTLVRSIDIAPTIARMLDYDIPGSWQGEDLFAHDNEVDYVFSEESLNRHVFFSVLNREWKYIEANPDNPRNIPSQELFNIAEDPGEKNNLISKELDVASELQKVLNNLKLVAAGQAVKGQETEIDDATRERLKALGYIK
jgi:arylsulfatase A-like enzyme